MVQRLQHLPTRKLNPNYGQFDDRGSRGIRHGCLVLSHLWPYVLVFAADSVYIFSGHDVNTGEHRRLVGHPLKWGKKRTEMHRAELLEKRSRPRRISCMPSFDFTFPSNLSFRRGR